MQIQATSRRDDYARLRVALDRWKNIESQMDERKPRVAIHYQNVIVDGCRRPLRISDSGTSVCGTSFFARVSRQTYLSLSINSTRSNDFHGGPESRHVLLVTLLFII